ncbi:MAG: AI-2E family transporter, partial [Actinobacteria bacterium]|nr:AI-2E family transporter [Actinomycetota bacterium]
IAAGLLAAGIVGALLAVPLLAVLNAGIRSLLSDAGEPPHSTDPLIGHPTDPLVGQPEEATPER